MLLQTLFRGKFHAKTVGIYLINAEREAVKLIMNWEQIFQLPLKHKFKWYFH